jgi:parvulin-like peptidyl-prolyl isomerase
MVKIIRVALLTAYILGQFYCVAEVSTRKSERKVVDRIVAFVDGSKILKSDLAQPRIARDGKPYALDELILETVMAKRAAERHVLPADADVERQIVSFKIQNNIGDIPDEEFEKQLKGYGFTLKMYRDQLAWLLASENLKRMEIGDKIVVTSQEVEAHFNGHPIFSSEEYNLNMLPVKSTSETLGAATLGLKNENINLGWIKKEDLDKKFHFVFKMKKGDVSEKSVKINEKDYFVKVVDHRARKKITLSQRYGEIEKLLTKVKIDNELKDFEKNLMAESTVEMVDPIKQTQT